MESFPVKLLTRRNRAIQKGDMTRDECNLQTHWYIKLLNGFEGLRGT